MMSKLDVTIMEKGSSETKLSMRKKSTNEAILESGLEEKPLRQQQLMDESKASLHGSSTQIHFKWVILE